MRSSLRLLALLLLALLACTTPRTQIILLVETDMNQGPAGPLTHIRVTVSQPGGLPRQRLTYRLGAGATGAGLYALPGTLGITARDNDGTRSVEVKVDAVSDPGGPGTNVAPLFTYTAIAPFESERTLLMPVFLAGRCRTAPPCEPGFTCGRERCEQIQRTLRAVPSAFTVDAGALVDAADDATSLDAPDAAPDVSPDVAPSCVAPTIRCGDVCVDPGASVAHCGACGTRCTAGPNATADCAAGRCVLVCGQGFADCDNNPANGCEVDLRADVRHCGRCGAACSDAGGTPGCAAGACRITCAPGRGDCDGSLANGCEADLLSTDHCGACGTRCALPGAMTHRCEARSCVVGVCAPGRGDCDRIAANGCEAFLTADPVHCGACGRRCGAGEVCGASGCTTSCATGLTACAGACVDTAANPLHCGRCGNACPTPPNTLATCAAGACGFVCVSGFADCDGVATNGCEVDTRSDGRHCGACGRACALPNGRARCVASACVFDGCDGNFGDCDGRAANGCEASLLTDAAHCGACGARCALPNATSACAAGMCAVTRCDANHGDCDRVAANGCETSTETPAHCGACGVVCALPNARVGCPAGACGIVACNGTFADCDRNGANGCEVDTATSSVHCGRCNNACPAGMRCSNGRCAADCAAPTTLCGAACVDTSTSPAHCGACNFACAGRPNMTAGCAAGACTYVCNLGFADCDGAPANGCETNLAADANHCGTCRNVCVAPMGGSAACAGGACVQSCPPGTTPCAGACRSLQSDVNHCGMCGSACMAGPNASPRCERGSCQVVCDAGYEDCNRNPRDGCEVAVGAPCSAPNGCARGTYFCDRATGMAGCSVTTFTPCMIPCPTIASSNFCDGVGNCVTPPLVCGGGSDGGTVVTDGGDGMLDGGRDLDGGRLESDLGSALD